MDAAFITQASEILGDTDKGLSGSEIVKYCSAYAFEFNVEIPVGEYPFPIRLQIPNKRYALRKNLMKFNDHQRYVIIKDLCELLQFKHNDEVKELRVKLVNRYGYLSSEKMSETELVQKTKHWLAEYPESLVQYNNALNKYETGMYQRNTLDDIRLSFELMVKKLLNNTKSLENQISDIGDKLKNANTSAELRNMITTIINYYTKYQNNYVKHDDKVNESEIEYIIETTSIIMKFLIKTLGR